MPLACVEVQARIPMVCGEEGRICGGKKVVDWLWACDLCHDAVVVAYCVGLH